MAASNDFLKFRSALNGFHRADVIHYLEQNARQHEERESCRYKLAHS